MQIPYLLYLLHDAHDFFYETASKMQNKISTQLELMFMKHYAPNRCLYIKVAKLRTGMGSAEMSHLQNRCLKISG